MGTCWTSYAEVVSLEPERIKALVRQMSRDTKIDGDTGELEDVTCCGNVEIIGNSVFFFSWGYGCYGTDIDEQPDAIQLFEKLFERYSGALIAFEHVHPMQEQGYHFNTLWAKPEGEVDWDNEEAFYRHTRAVCEGSSMDSIDHMFDIVDCWYIDVDSLDKEVVPNLYKVIQRAKEEGFEDWEKGETSDYFSDVIYDDDENDYISTDIIDSICEQYWDERGDDDQEIAYFAKDEIQILMADWIHEPMDDIPFELEMPTDFPDLQLYGRFPKVFFKPLPPSNSNYDYNGH